MMNETPPVFNQNAGFEKQKPASPDNLYLSSTGPGKPGRENDAPGQEHVHEVDEPSLRDLPITIWNIPRFLLLVPIRIYQATLSRTLPPDTCRFYPTCSHYGYQAIYKYGAIKGGWMATWRVLRCNPFNRGGFDPVP